MAKLMPIGVISAPNSPEMPVEGLIGGDLASKSPEMSNHRPSGGENEEISPGDAPP